MLSPKRLVGKAKKGIPLALMMRSNSSSRVVAEKGHFVVYTVEDVRFMLPLSFLKSPVLQELLKVQRAGGAGAAVYRSGKGATSLWQRSSFAVTLSWSRR
ncbi:auxin-responsive protein SAUR68-like [Zingiber officinale]|uniref:auxin-responsive protein SAUR68-like n=1 Tax=Zingiber officinale TaxID=94328 RepID=UPI001C4C0F4C|nr:auxin-responsive protein SAUR68-like [Zingiber officinale]